MKPVKLGVIGCGAIGSYHIDGALEDDGIDLVAVADINKGLADSKAEQFGIAKAYAGGSELLADKDVEAVVLAMPTGVRSKLALQALAAGKHVLLEKPVAMNAAEVQSFIDARGGLTVACCSSRYQFVAYAQTVRNAVTSGMLGPVRMLRARCNNPGGPRPTSARPAWRLKKSANGGGILMNWGPYDLDYLLSAAGWQLEPKTVLAQVWQIAPDIADHIPADSDAETHAAALIRCAGGEMIYIDRGEYMAYASENAWQIVGTKGSIRQPIYPGNPEVIYLDEISPEHGMITRTLWEGDPVAKNIHYGVLSDFAAAIRERRPPRTGLEQALIVQKITDAIYESAEKGCAVDIP